MDLDSLIEQSRRQASSGAGSGQQQGQQQGQQMAQARAGQREVAEVQGQQAQGQRQGSNAAEQSQAPGESATKTDLSAEIKETASEWGRISPRTRNAVIEGSSEQVIEKYRRYVEDYYKGVATKGTQ